VPPPQTENTALLAHTPLNRADTPMTSTTAIVVYDDERRKAAATERTCAYCDEPKPASAFDAGLCADQCRDCATIALMAMRVRRATTRMAEAVATATDDVASRKCGWCKKTLAATAFGTHKKTGAPLSRCLVCHQKHSFTGHTSRAIEAMERKAADEKDRNPLGLPTQKCRRCCKTLPETAFATNPKSGELYSKCEACRPKHAASSHKDDAVGAEANDETVDSTPTQECGYCCKTLPTTAFATNPTLGRLYSKCEVCRPKHAKTSNASANNGIVKKRYKTTAQGKASNKRYKHGEVGKATDKRYKHGEVGKSADKRYRQGDAGKASRQRYRHGETGKASNKRYKHGDAGKATAKRFVAKLRSRRQQSSAMRMDNKVLCNAHKLIAGLVSHSPKFLERTSFHSCEEFVALVRARCVASGFNFDRHDDEWQLDHKIPRAAYDFDEPGDAKHCWSLANVHVLSVSDNWEKSWKLLDHWIASAGVDCFPAAWQGRPPTEAMKKAHADKMMAAKALEESANLEDALVDEDGGLIIDNPYELYCSDADNSDHSDGLFARDDSDSDSEPPVDSDSD
jgi:hypothetical protein